MNLALAETITPPPAPVPPGGVSVQFGDSVRTAVQKTGKNADAEQARIERDVNDALRELAKTDPDAKALYDSGQTLHIVCFGHPEAEGITQETGPVLGGDERGRTRGDFDAAGRPKPRGMTLIVIDCEKLVAAKGFDAAAYDDGESMLGVLFHELAHASNEARKHGTGEAFNYEAWVRSLVAALAAARKASPLPPPNPRIVGGQTFNDGGRARAAQRLMEQAEIATGNCDYPAYLRVIQDLIAAADTLLARAATIVPTTAAAARRAATLRADAAALQALAAKLAAEIAARFKNCPGLPAGALQTGPPAPPPGTQPPAPPAGTTPKVATPVDPNRVGDERFNDPRTAEEARAIVAKGWEPYIEAREFSRAELRALARRLRAEAARFRQAQSQAADARAAQLEQDAAAVDRLANPRLVGDHEFFSARDAARVKDLARAAENAANRQAYIDAINALRRLEKDLADRYTPDPRVRPPEESSAYYRDAEAVRALADKLEQELETRFPPGTPGAALDRPRPDTGYAINIQPGGTLTWTPQVPGGTIFTRPFDPTSAVPLAQSGSQLSGGGVRIDAKIPLGDPLGSGRDWTFMPRVLYAYADAHTSGMVAPGPTTTGGISTGRAYLSPAPDGTTGLNYFSTGQAVDIRSHAHQFGLDLLLATRVLQGRMHGWAYHVFAGGGVSYRFDWTGHTIGERNLTFDGVWSRTELKTDDHFFGARFAGGAKVENGRWHASLAAYVAPGVVVSNASARQWNACSLCLPPNDSFMVAHERTKTGFGVRTGVGAMVGYNLTSSIRIGAFAQFDYSSRQSVWRNPVKPQPGPPHLGVDDAMSAAFGIRIGIFLP
jgi:hypothetical protein